MFVSNMDLSSPPPPNTLHIARQKRKWRSSVDKAPKGQPTIDQWHSIISSLLEAPQTTGLRAHKEKPAEKLRERKEIPQWCLLSRKDSTPSEQLWSRFCFHFADRGTEVEELEASFPGGILSVFMTITGWKGLSLYCKHLRHSLKASSDSRLTLFLYCYSGVTTGKESKATPSQSLTRLSQQRLWVDMLYLGDPQGAPEETRVPGVEVKASRTDFAINRASLLGCRRNEVK